MGLLRGTQLEALAPPSPEDQAWEEIIRDATQQGLLPILYRWLKTSDSRYLPSALRLDQIKEGVVGVAARNVVLAQELVSILQAFQVRQVACVPVRGLALAELLYGDITARPMGDIDLLVRKEDLSKVAEVLKGLEFQEMDRRPGFASAFSYTLEFFKDRHGGVIVEPHWSIAYPPFADRVDMEAVWERCVRGRVVDVDTWLLSREDLLVHLCCHLIHRGESASLLWLYEIDRLLRQEKATRDWPQVISLAQETGLALFVVEVLGKVKGLFDSPIPDDVLSQLRAQRRPQPARAVESQLARLLMGESRLDGGESFAMLFTIKGMRAKLRYAVAILFPSPEFMRLQYGLSTRWQLPLAYLTRFFHLSWEGLKGVVGLFLSRRTPRQRLF
ncbi:nucleotidyltransferase family protein [Candidatus Methylomirabilis sp.]|uniref:nucleotidyltransferase domain-containing protein n=1 Tax=Candidatus Methylomirabilis sp. TaxID=2032687 RepID=UPI002A622117|nr:nucleotidyltransferase family protein [Candidatus Methylomirabilis sp.]